MLYGDWIGRWGKSFPEKEALVDAIGNRRYTYGQLAREVNRMAHFLGSILGTKKGDPWRFFPQPDRIPHYLFLQPAGSGPFWSL